MGVGTRVALQGDEFAAHLVCVGRGKGRSEEFK